MKSVYSDSVDKVSNERTISLVLPSTDSDVVLAFTVTPSLQLYGRRVVSITLKKTGFGIFTPNLGGNEDINVRGDQMPSATKVKSGWITYKGDYYTMAEEFLPVREWLSGDKLYLRATGNGTWTFDIADDKNVKTFITSAIEPYAKRTPPKPPENPVLAQGREAARAWEYKGTGKPSPNTIMRRAEVEARKQELTGDDFKLFVSAFIAEVGLMNRSER